MDRMVEAKAGMAAKDLHATETVATMVPPPMTEHNAQRMGQTGHRPPRTANRASMESPAKATKWASTAAKEVKAMTAAKGAGVAMVAMVGRTVGTEAGVEMVVKPGFCS